jgi:hypothetical protein
MRVVPSYDTQGGSLDRSVLPLGIAVNIPYLLLHVVRSVRILYIYKW